jgi:hypothetical protein
MHSIILKFYVYFVNKIKQFQASPISHESDLDFGDPEEIEPSSISNFIKRRRLERVKKGPKQRSRPDANLEKYIVIFLTITKQITKFLFFLFC